MNLESLVAELGGALTGSVTAQASLGQFTTFRVGGPADILVEAADENDLIALARIVKGTVAVAIVGRGSNLLVSDEGFRGIAVRLGKGMRTSLRLDDGMRFGGAVPLPVAARLTAKGGFQGFEFAAEIPAAFGGAVRMNAGAHGRCMADVLDSTRTVDLATSEVRSYGVDELGYSYRHSDLRVTEVVVSGDLKLEPGDPETVGQTITGYLDWRRENQPGGRSAGSVFKNPEGDSAGRLLDEAGAKQMSVGGAKVSEVHANFIVADKQATALDVWTLIRRLQDTVQAKSGVVLEPEVRFLGTFPQVEGWSKGELEG